MGFQTMSEQHPELTVREVILGLRVKDNLEAANTKFEIDPSPENERALIEAQVAYDMLKER